MAFDGIVIANLVHDFKEAAEGGRISKIAQPEADEILLTVKKDGKTSRISLSANASLPMARLVEENKISPLQAPNFCMLLRKHISGGQVQRIYQPMMDRIICIEILHYNDLGDLCRKDLYMELMGKHSNLVFCDEDGMILDCIKHVSARQSSLRELLPGKEYVFPHTADKFNPLEETGENFVQRLSKLPFPLAKAIYSAYYGISPLIAQEICFRAGLEPDVPAKGLPQEHLLHLSNHFLWLMEDVKEGHFYPNLVVQGKEPVAFSSVKLTQYRDAQEIRFDSVSEMLESYYSAKERFSRIRQKSADLRKTTSTALERCRRKYDLQEKQLSDTQKREKYRLYGELLNAYGYQVEPGLKKCELLNYYDGKMVTVPLDPQKTAAENAQHYFEKYSKMKRTYEDLSQRTMETKADMEHLQSVATWLDIAQTEADLAQVREELEEAGYLKKHAQGRKKMKRAEKSVPFHYISSDGFDIYVGKNNLQNEELTFHVANGGDWWFHAKKMPGSHVIVRTGGKEMTDRAFEEAGALAAYYSSGRNQEKVEIDYLQRKNVKKPNGARPGFVVYYTNYSLMAKPDISGLKEAPDSGSLRQENHNGKGNGSKH